MLKYPWRHSFLLLFFSVLALLSAEEMELRVSVIPFSAEGVSEAAAKTFSDLFEIALIKSERYIVVEANERDRILEAQAFTLSGCSDDSCAVEIGQLLAADRIFLGTVSSLGSKTYLNIKLVDIEQGKSLKAETLGADSLEALSELVSQMIPRLEGEMGTITVTVEPSMSGTLYLDGREYGRFPGDVEIVPGEHTIRAVAEISGKFWEGSVTINVQADEQMSLEIGMLSTEDLAMLEGWQRDYLEIQRQLSAAGFIGLELEQQADALFEATRMIAFDAGSLPDKIAVLRNTIKQLRVRSSRRIRIDQDDFFIEYNRDVYAARKGPRAARDLWGGILTAVGAGLAGYTGYLFAEDPRMEQSVLLKLAGTGGAVAGLTGGILLLCSGPDPDEALRAVDLLEAERDALLRISEDSLDESWKKAVPFYGKRFNSEKIEPLNGSRIIESTPTLRWNRISGAAGYFVQIGSPDDIIEHSDILHCEKEELTIPDDLWISPGEKRQWRVCAVNSEGLPGTWSDLFLFEVTENRLIITSEPAESDVYLDGKFRGATPLTLDDAGSGPHIIALKKKGYADVEEPVDLPVGVNRLDFTLIKPLIEMIQVEAGSFMMGGSSGGNDERPAHKVEIAHDFYISRYEVMFELFDRFTTATGREPARDRGWGRENMPAISVTWFDAVDFCNWLSIEDGLNPCYTVNGQTVVCDFEASGYRLPTEAEWEYAAAGGAYSQGHIWSGSDHPGEVAHYAEERKQAVGQLQANELGLYDMSGNAWEWCWDYYDDGYYSVSPSVDPAGPVSGSYRVIRGGGPKNSADNVRIRYRNYGNPATPDKNYGFRVAARFR